MELISIALRIYAEKLCMELNKHHSCLVYDLTIYSHPMVPDLQTKIVTFVNTLVVTIKNQNYPLADMESLCIANKE